MFIPSETTNPFLIETAQVGIGDMVELLLYAGGPGFLVPPQKNKNKKAEERKTV
jgi:hypothetical protein